METLRLEVRDFLRTDSGMEWHWTLRDADGRALGERRAALPGDDWRYDAFTDLHGYLRRYAGPYDDRQAGAEEIIAQVAAWVDEHAYGPLTGALARLAPCEVDIRLPGQAHALAFLPLELPLRALGVTVCMDLGFPAVRIGGGRGARILALFSLPDVTAAMNLRRERRRIAGLVERLRAGGRDVELRVLQYGVTRRRLAEAISEGGWDVLHLSGHGSGGLITLEAEDGGRDPVSGDDLAELLAPLSGVTRLVFASACESATHEARAELLRLTDPGGQGYLQVYRRSPGVAPALAERLGCPVIGMRFPVAEPFAAGLAEDLFAALLDEGLSLAEALSPVRAGPDPRHAPSAAGVTVFGRDAAAVRLTAPAGDARPPLTAGIPGPPERFVGRVGMMSRASRALAPGSGLPAVLFHGMAGAGKSSCAQELAHLHAGGFDQVVWFGVPDEPADPLITLADLVIAMEQAVDGLRFVELLGDAASLAVEQRGLAARFGEKRLLLVVDGCEPLLDAGGEWRDERWRLLVDMLTGHTGPARTVLTSRHRPAAVDPDRVLVETVDTLPEAEAALLAAELPNLGMLAAGRSPLLTPEYAAGLARRVVAAAHGHPTLLELADAQAATPEVLLPLLGMAESVWAGQAGDYLSVLRSWTLEVVGRLAAPQRLMALFLACLEPADRTSDTVARTWSGVWQAYGEGETPRAVEAAGPLVGHGLVSIEGEDAEPGLRLGVHPAVAAAIRDHADPAVRESMDRSLAHDHDVMARQAIRRAEEGGSTAEAVAAARTALPYLLRSGMWEEAAYLLEPLLLTDYSPETLRWALTPLRRCAGALEGTELEIPVRANLARALQAVDSRAAGDLLSSLYTAALEKGDDAATVAASGDLIDMWLVSGRVAEALALADRTVAHTDRRDLWMRIAVRAQRQRILLALGRAEEVLPEVYRLMEEAGGPPEAGGHERGGQVRPWAAWEMLLRSGQVAAGNLGRGEESLELGGRIVRSQLRRGASELDLARTRFENSAVLIGMGRHDEALQELHHCRQVFEKARDKEYLGKTLGALAAVRMALGHEEPALSIGADALRYSYLAGNAHDIAIAHNNLGVFRFLQGRPGSLTHLLASALLAALAGRTGVDTTLRVAAARMSGAVPDRVAASPAELCAAAGGPLAAALDRIGSPREQEEAFDVVVHRLLPAAVAQLAPYLVMWDTVLEGMHAAAGGDHEAETMVRVTFADNEDYQDLITALRAIAAGQRHSGVLSGLGVTELAVARRAMDVFDGRVRLPAQLWRSMPVATLLFRAVAAALGDADAAQAVADELLLRESDHLLAGVVDTLPKVLAGERGPRLLDGLTPAHAAAVAAVLDRIEAAERPV
ncbi:hypothetical protein GCM10009530_61960 [Microbispora corallina]|uniref:CHAT domain-containing protein n=1 Tax=Microbispora corallina TaxID=83302 RepID=A0ABQ4G8H4_9ACTN|nr:CHAT domain-containing protein [Microbispora corallina]GIH43381.1 hypothetical protein Mco01_63810 [Microbispora corallina]